jgi:hypothetical protein
VIAPADLDALKSSGRFDVVEGPATRWGARGDATSLYVRDPDGNTVELRYYGETTDDTPGKLPGPAAAERTWQMGVGSTDDI